MVQAMGFRPWQTGTNACPTQPESAALAEAATVDYAFEHPDERNLHFVPAVRRNRLEIGGAGWCTPGRSM